MWQWHAPELWRRFAIALRRSIAHHLHVSEARLSEHASVQYAKVAEYQTRGLIHFHALIQLDGPATAGTGSPAPTTLTGHDLADLVRDVVPTVTVLADDADTTTQVIGSWTYAGTGWRDDTEEALALATAARSREYDLWKAQRRTTRRGH